MTEMNSLDADEARYELYELMATDRSFEEKATQALELGERILDVQNGHLTRIEPESNFWEAVASTDPPDGEFPPNLVLDLETTYCRRTIESDETVALHDAETQGWEDDPAFEEHGLHCYHGTVITIAEETYGTVCFVSEQPRGEAFDSSETLFAELIARMLEHEIERTRTQAKIEQLDTFAAAVSHDLRNPLNVAQLRINAEREMRDSENLQAASDALDRIQQLITDVLAIARGADEVKNPERVDLETIAQESWQTVQTTGARLQLHSAATFLADPDRLKRLFENLYRNAIEHGTTSTESMRNEDGGDAHGSETVTVRVGTLDEATGFYIEDDGPGIPPADRERIFSADFSTGTDGIGLGLAIVDSIVTAHEWTITATESESGGARFEISDVVAAIESGWGEQ